MNACEKHRESNCYPCALETIETLRKNFAWAFQQANELRGLLVVAERHLPWNDPLVPEIVSLLRRIDEAEGRAR